MKFSSKGHTVVITELPDEPSDLSQQLSANKAKWQNCHIVLVVGSCDLSPDIIYQSIKSVLAEQVSSNRSFILVDQPERLIQYPEDLSAAPTQDEAFDLIEMEEIERDLGF